MDLATICTARLFTSADVTINSESLPARSINSAIAHPKLSICIQSFLSEVQTFVLSKFFQEQGTEFVIGIRVAFCSYLIYSQYELFFQRWGNLKPIDKCSMSHILHVLQMLVL